MMPYSVLGMPRDLFLFFLSITADEFFALYNRVGHGTGRAFTRALLSMSRMCRGFEFGEFIPTLFSNGLSLLVYHR